MTEDQRVVDTGVDDQGNDRDIERDPDRSDAAQSRHQHIGENKEREGEQDDLHVHFALLDDGCIPCEKVQQGRGEKAADKGIE